MLGGGVQREERGEGERREGRKREEEREKEKKRGEERREDAKNFFFEGLLFWEEQIDWEAVCSIQTDENTCQAIDAYSCAIDVWSPPLSCSSAPGIL